MQVYICVQHPSCHRSSFALVVLFFEVFWRITVHIYIYENEYHNYHCGPIGIYPESFAVKSSWIITSFEWI